MNTISSAEPVSHSHPPSGRHDPPPPLQRHPQREFPHVFHSYGSSSHTSLAPQTLDATPPNLSPIFPLAPSNSADHGPNVGRSLGTLAPLHLDCSPASGSSKDFHHAHSQKADTTTTTTTTSSFSQDFSFSNSHPTSENHTGSRESSSPVPFLHPRVPVLKHPIESNFNADTAGLGAHWNGLGAPDACQEEIHLNLDARDRPAMRPSQSNKRSSKPSSPSLNREIHQTDASSASDDQQTVPGECRPIIKETSTPRGGRKRGMRLPPETRADASAMRHYGACANCRKRRIKCDRHLVCANCIKRFGPRLLEDEQHCRGPILETLIDLISATKWQPRPYHAPDCLRDRFSQTGVTVPIPIRFQGGPSLIIDGVLLQQTDAAPVMHSHVNCEPHSTTLHYTSQDHVLPVLLSESVDMKRLLIQHVRTLVESHFFEFDWGRKFPLIDHVYSFYELCREQNLEHATLLGLSLNLLVLVNLEISIDRLDPWLQSFLASSDLANQYNPHILPVVTPCLIRVEFGKALQSLVKDWFKSVLEGILKISLRCQEPDHPIVLAIFASLMSALELISFKAARLPYHLHHFPGESNICSPSPNHPPLAPHFTAYYYSADGHPGTLNIINSNNATPDTSAGGNTPDEMAKCADILLNIYADCFANFHGPLLQPWDRKARARAKRKSGEVPAEFLERVNDSMQENMQYLEAKSGNCNGNDVENIQDGLNGHADIFDRLTSRLLLLKCD